MGERLEITHEWILKTLMRTNITKWTRIMKKALHLEFIVRRSPRNGKVLYL